VLTVTQDAEDAVVDVAEAAGAGGSADDQHDDDLGDPLQRLRLLREVVVLGRFGGALDERGRGRSGLPCCRLGADEGGRRHRTPSRRSTGVFITP